MLYKDIVNIRGSEVAFLDPIFFVKIKKYINRIFLGLKNASTTTYYDKKYKNIRFLKKHGICYMINNKNTEVVQNYENSSNNKYNFKGSSNFLNRI